MEIKKEENMNKRIRKLQTGDNKDIIRCRKDSRRTVDNKEWVVNNGSEGVRWCKLQYIGNSSLTCLLSPNMLHTISLE